MCSAEWLDQVVFLPIVSVAKMAADGEGSNARTREFAEARKLAKTKTIEIDAKKMLTESMANGFDQYMEQVIVPRLQVFVDLIVVPLCCWIC